MFMLFSKPATSPSKAQPPSLLCCVHANVFRALTSLAELQARLACWFESLAVASRPLQRLLAEMGAAAEQR
jgi:hypothetical protein